MNPKPKKKVEKLTPKFWSPETYRNHHLASAKKFLEFDDLDENEENDENDENEHCEEQEKFLDAWEERENQTVTEKLLKRKNENKFLSHLFFNSYFQTNSLNIDFLFSF